MKTSDVIKLMKTSLMSVIDKLAPFKTKRVKGNLQEWFDGKVLESIALREIYNKARNKSHRLILQKKRE